MYFLVNENMPSSVVVGLRAAGHDVLYAKESMMGAKDDSILARAQQEQRVLLSQDKDFGELAIRRGLPAGCGVVLFRLSGLDRELIVTRMLEVLTTNIDWRGQISVVDERRIRSRALPTQDDYTV